MTAQKWKLIGGHVYRLSAVFDSGHDAVVHARELREDRDVIISKTKDEQWAVYWRRTPDIEPNLATHCGLTL
ncbi:hypothetical protein EU519_00115 [Candidatus Thorarchaeota archaeon]|nr:MAG: hypothetical protein EU519_00115 [Candidatus Thorarchaeota archaeon]